MENAWYRTQAEVVLQDRLLLGPRALRRLQLYLFCNSASHVEARVGSKGAVFV